jgi:hypothetical protein
LKSGIHRHLAAAMVLFAGSLCAFAQIQPVRGIGDGAMSPFASCHDESTGKRVGSHKSRTVLLVSPDGRYRAFAESEAVASQANEVGTPECKNFSKLYVASPSGLGYRAVLELNPLPEALGNSIDLIDWSPHGHRLLLAQGVWQWGSDAGATRARIYDADTKQLSSEGFVEAAV